MIGEDAMNRENVSEKIKKIMAEILEVTEDMIEDDSAIGDLDNWDSLNHLKIISSIEQEFGIQFTPDVLMDIEDFSDIVRAVEERVR
jgi:acyl carrier protein